MADVGVARQNWLGENIREDAEFSDKVMALARQPIERELHSLTKYLNGVRNYNFVPVSAPYAFGCAIESALKSFEEDGVGPLSTGVSPGVMKMVRGIVGALGLEDRDPPRDRRPRVVFARVDCREESEELSDLLLRCMREYGLSFVRGRGYAIEGCMFRDSPLMALQQLARDEVMRGVGQGGPLVGECCSDCMQRYRESPEKIRVVGFDVADCYGYVGVGFTDHQEALCAASRGLLEVHGVATEHGDRALRAALGGRPVRVRSRNMIPDVLVLCPLDWDEPIPGWTLPHALVVESERISEAGEVLESFGRRISGALEMWKCHMAPHVPRVAATFADGGAGAYRSTGSTLRALESEPAAMGKCMSHKSAVRMFLADAGAAVEKAQRAADDVYDRMVMDIRKADGSSEDSRFEREGGHKARTRLPDAPGLYAGGWGGAGEDWRVGARVAR